MSETLTTKDAAKQLGVSVWTVARMVRDGRLAPVDKYPGQTGGYRFDPAKLPSGGGQPPRRPHH